MIRRCDDRDFELIWTIINDGAQAYRGTIPPDRWTEPYMSREELQREIDDGVVFWGFEEAGNLVGIMGIQKVQDVTLIRHAYVRTSSQKRGIGGDLLSHLQGLISGPVLIGTWASAVWAIRFYERHGFQMVGPQEKNRLLKKYWTVPERQIETSVVLADSKWQDLRSTAQLSQVEPSLPRAITAITAAGTFPAKQLTMNRKQNPPMSPTPEDLTILKDDMIAFIEGHGMRRFHGYVDYDEVQCVMWEMGGNPDGWKDFVELAKAAAAPFLTMHSWTLERTELDEMVQRLTNSEFTDRDDVEDARWLRAHIGKVGFLQLGWAYQGSMFLCEVSTEWYDRYQHLLEVSDEFGGLTLDEPDQDEEN